MRRALILILLMTSWLLALPAEDGLAAKRSFPITYKGKARAVIALGETASAADAWAAGELARYLHEMTGADIPVLENRNRPVRRKTTIFVGPNPYLAKRKIKVSSLDEDAYIIRTLDRDKIVLLGNGLRGTIYSVHAFLETLGCRWYMPGELGEVVPKVRILNVKTMNRRESPDFGIRYFQGVGELPALDKNELIDFHNWMLRNRINRGYTVGYWHFNVFNGPAAHAYSDIIPKDKFDEMPELFPLIQGQRRLANQRCVSNPQALVEAQRYVDAHFRKNPTDDIISVSPNDAGGWCQCDACNAWDLPDQYIMGPVWKERSFSGRAFRYAGLIARHLQAEHPDKQAVIYAYEKYSLPPTGFIPPDNLIIKLTHNLHACDAHAIKGQQCELNKWWRESVVDGWSDLTPNLWYHLYAYRWKACELPYPKWRSIDADVRYLHQAGVWGFFAHAGFSNWGSNGLYYYALSKLMWDVDTDMDALVRDYCTHFYGSAAKPMRAYLEHMADAFETRNGHVENIGGVNLAFAEQFLPIYTPQVLEHGQHLLEKALAAARTDQARSRIALTAFTHRYATLFMDFLQANQERKNVGSPENIQKTIDAGQRVLDLVQHEYIPWSVNQKISIYGAGEAVRRILAEISGGQP